MATVGYIDHEFEKEFNGPYYLVPGQNYLAYAVGADLGGAYGLTLPDPYLQVIDSQYNLVATADNSGILGLAAGDDAIAVFTVAQEGYYYMLVGSSLAVSSDVGSYEADIYAI